MLSLVDVTSAIVLPAIRAVFKDSEVSAFELRLSGDYGDSVSLSLTVAGEAFVDNVVQGDIDGMSAEQWGERLRSNLVDFVAESRFGWGQNRDVR